MDGTSIVLGLVGLAIAGYAVDWWTKQSPRLPTNLRCANCPQLQVKIRRTQALAAFLGIIAAGALLAWLAKP